jgi:hypothetical protein
MYIRFGCPRFRISSEKIVKIVLMILILFISVAFGQQPNHGIYPVYDAFLKRHTCSTGVAYKTISNDDLKTVAVELHALSRPAFDSLNTNNQMAWLINLYNFATIQLIKQHYPLKKGIRDIGSPWKIKFIPFCGETVSLDYLEHEVLRKKYHEPRIHFAVVCASKGCPALRNEAYTGARLDVQLEDAARVFLTDTTKNRIDGHSAQLSKIFEWYGDDFKKPYGSFTAYVQRVLGLSGTYSVSFNEYDWRLNDTDMCP